MMKNNRNWKITKFKKNRKINRKTEKMRKCIRKIRD